MSACWLLNVGGVLLRLSDELEVRILSPASVQRSRLWQARFSTFTAVRSHEGPSLYYSHTILGLPQRAIVAGFLNLNSRSLALALRRR